MSPDLLLYLAVGLGAVALGRGALMALRRKARGRAFERLGDRTLTPAGLSTAGANYYEDDPHRLLRELLTALEETGGLTRDEARAVLRATRGTLYADAFEKLCEILVSKGTRLERETYERVERLGTILNQPAGLWAPLAKTVTALLLLLMPAIARAQDLSGLDSVHQYVEAERARQRIPGLSLAVLRGDTVLLSRGYGFANIELGVPATDSTIYQSGSVGKQFTAAAVVMLAEQGRLRLDDRITRWLKEGNGLWDGITVRHLLTHTSGMAEYTDSTFDYRRDFTEDELVRFAASRPLDFSPGDQWSYSNTGYLLLGVLIRRVTGRFYGDVLHDLILAPLGMTSTRVISEADIVMNRSAGYRLVREQIKNQEWVSPSINTTADGALYFSVSDLARWAVALNHGRVPGDKVLQQAWSPVRLNDGGVYPYGFGWSLTEQRGHARVGHTGSWQGFRTAIYGYPEFDLTVIALANLEQAEVGALVHGIAGILEPAVRPPHLLKAALKGPAPPVPVPVLLRQIARGEPGGATPGLSRFLQPAVRQGAGNTLAEVKSWTALGCDRVTSGGIVRLDASIEHICYGRGVGKSRRVVVSVFYTGDWRPAFFESEDY